MHTNSETSLKRFSRVNIANQMHTLNFRNIYITIRYIYKFKESELCVYVLSVVMMRYKGGGCLTGGSRALKYLLIFLEEKIHIHILCVPIPIHTTNMRRKIAWILNACCINKKNEDIVVAQKLL